MNHVEGHLEAPSASVRNARMTALAGALLFILIVIELIITANLHALISEHIFVGVLLSGPLLVKLCSTGYRFIRYYAGSMDFVRQGPPFILLRLLAPVLVFVTLAVFVSGFGLAVAGPNHTGLFFKVHAASVALWLPLLGVHLYGHIRKVPRLIASDWSIPSERAFGRGGRLGINIGALLAGLLAAILMIPISTPWQNWRTHGGLPSPLILGIVAAIFAVFIATWLFPKVKRGQ